MDAATVKELRATLWEVFAAAEPVDDQVAALGWTEAAADDPAATTVAYFEEQGRALATSGMLGSLAAQALSVDAAVALPIRGRTPLHVALGAVPGPVVVDGVLVAEPVTEPVPGLDPDLPAVSVRGDGEPVDGWRDALTVARRALASELVGVGLGALALATDHVAQRTQFGRPIGTYQAVRHRLAECHVLLVAAQALVDVAWESGGADDADLAKAAAGRAADRTVRTAMQVHGAIGLSWEHRLHRYVRRAAVLDALAGDATWLERDLGTRLAAGTLVP